MRTFTTSIIFYFTVLIILCGQIGVTYANTQFSISERTYKKLEKVEHFISQKQEKEALSLLDDLEASTKNKKYELTLVYQAFGYVYYDTNRTDKALEYFEKCLALDFAPKDTLQSIRKNLIQIYGTSNNYSKAINHFKEWVKNETNPPPDILALGGILYTYVKEYDSAIMYLQRAIDKTNPAKESWYNALLSIYYERKDYQTAITLLQKIIVLYPDNKQYWKQLFTAFYLNNDFENALSTLQIAYTNHILEDEEDIINLAKLSIYLNIPVNAINLLESELSKQHLIRNKENLELLASAYLQSRDVRQAAHTYVELGKLTNNSEQYLLAARLFFEARSWDDVIDVLSNTKLDPNLSQAHLLKGISFAELNQREKAIQEFYIAKQHSDAYQTANQWLDYLNSK